MKALYFSKADGRNYYRCGCCRQDFSILVEAMNQVMVGCDCMAIVCQGCFVKARELVSAALPHSFPDLDEAGNLLGESRSRLYPFDQNVETKKLSWE